jgi:hypothetical protein
MLKTNCRKWGVAGQGLKYSKEATRADGGVKAGLESHMSDNPILALLQ